MKTIKSILALVLCAIGFAGTPAMAGDLPKITIAAYNAEKIYDGLPTNATYTVSEADATITVAYGNSGDEDWGDEEAYDPVKFTDCVDQYVRFTATKEGYQKAEAIAYVRITSRPVNVTAPNLTFPLDAEDDAINAEIESQIDIEKAGQIPEHGVLDGDEITYKWAREEASYKDGSREEGEPYEITFPDEGEYEDYNVTYQGNYEVCYVPGTVTFKSASDPEKPEISAESDEFTVDLRTGVNLAERETTVSNVAWSATLWNVVPETFTTVGWTNLTTGASGVFGNLSNIMGEGAKDAVLPQKDGEYVLTHSTGDLKSFATFTVSGYPEGCETNPWKVGPEDDPDGVVAWTDGKGNVYIKPPRSAVSRTGLESITNAMGGASFPVGLVSEDGTETNALVMVIGGSGARYDSIGEALEAGEDTCTLYDIKGCVVNYDGRGHSGTMASDTFLPGVPTNLTANAYSAFGYEFQGWTTNGDTEVVFEDMAEIADPQPGDVYDLKAVWKFAPVAIGADVIAYLDTNGTLHIEGDGAMKDFTAADPAPWAEFAPDIKAIEVEEGVTKIGNAAFWSFDYCLWPITETLVFQDETHELNLLAFVSEDGSVTNAPATSQFRVFKSESGTDEPAVAFGPKGSTLFYGSVEEALEHGDTTSMQLLTLDDTVAREKDHLVSIAGETPYSKAMQDILDEAFGKLDAAESYGDIVDVHAEYGVEDGKIEEQAEKDKPNEIGGTDITWRVMDGTVVIDGEGEMPDFVEPDYPEGAPWNERKGDITNMTVASGVTSVGDAAFAVCPAGEGASVLFRDPEAEIGLGAFVSGDGTETNAPTVKVEIVTEDGRTLRVAPGGWADADDPNVIYDSLEEALESGVRAVKAAFSKKTDEGEKIVPPSEVEEIVTKVDPETGKEIELTAKYGNVPTADGSAEGLVTEIENLPLIVDITGSNITVTVTATNKEEVASQVVGEMDEAMSNVCETVKADLGIESVETLGFKSVYLDMSAFWSLSGDGGRLVEFTKSIVAHIPMKLYEGQIYSVSRRHEGVTEVLPMWYEGIDDSDTAEWFWADVANQELVVKTRKFCDYALGTLELETSCAVVVGCDGKYVGDRDPVSLPTNFTFKVTGPHDGSEFAGYAKRMAGEAAGEYAINFVCVRMPADFPASGFTVKPGVFTIEDRADRIAPSGKVTYAKATKGNFLVPSKPATWKAKPGLGCKFAGWEWIGEGAEPSGFRKLSENERRNPTLKFTIGKKERIAPKDFAATWVRMDEDLLSEVHWAATNRLATDSRSYVTMSLKGVPSGLKFVAKKLAFSGKAKKNGRFKVTVTAKNASGYSLKQTGYLVVAGKKVVGYEPGVPKLAGVPLMLWCDTRYGSVSGTGVFTAKSKRKVSAKAKSGYVFAGWFADPGFSTPAKFVGGKDYRIAAQKIVVNGPTYLFARFLPKTTAADPITWLRYSGAGYCGAPAGFLDEQETWYQGVKLPANACQIAFISASLPTVTVKGLPSGVTFDKTTLRFKGVPTKSGTFTVKVTVKNKSAATDVLTRKVVVKALPKWAVGNFDGYHVEGGVTNGTFRATVGKTGKVSGKTAGGIASTTFSAKNFADVFTEDGSNLIYKVNVTVSYKSGKKTVKTTDTLYLMEDPLTGLGTIGGGDEDGCGAVGVQRAWSRADLALPAFATKPVPTCKLGNGLSLKFGAKGAVTIAGKIKGDNGKSVTVTGSTYVLPVAWYSTMTPNLFARTCVYVTPKKNLATGFCEVCDILLKVGASGKFDTVTVAPPEW